MRILLVLSILATLNPYKSNAQNIQDHHYHPPLGIPLVLASNFGELRPNHFHMGLDFKTNGKIGYNLYSVEEGFVSRIKVSPYGYGKVVYIDHPNGITSVYAHCSEFKGQLDSIVRKTQEDEQNFAIEVFPKKNEIKVKRGQVIAVSGNTGGSTAPHLHFELRDTKTEHGLNPLAYGFDMADHKSPEIRGVKVYSLSKAGYRYPNKSVRKTASKNGNVYVISENKISIPSNYSTKEGGIGFAFDVIDRFDGAGNKCGVYGSTLIINGDTIFGQKLDRIPFESTRYVNCHKDYEEYSQNKRKFHKSFRSQENDLPVYINDALGVFKAEPNKSYNVEFIAYDANNNQSELSFTLFVEPGNLGPNEPHMDDFDILLPSESMQVNVGSTEVQFGITTTYEPMKIDDSEIERNIGERNTPVHKAYKLSLKNPNPKYHDYYLEIKTAKGRSRALKLTEHEENLICKPKYFGSYKIKRDTIRPSVSPSGFSSSSTIYSKKQIQWRISDIGSGLNDYDLFINGKWCLLEYEYKNGLVSYSIDEEFRDGAKKDLVVRVKDECGNMTELRHTLIFR